MRDGGTAGYINKPEGLLVMRTGHSRAYKLLHYLQQYICVRQLTTFSANYYYMPGKYMKESWCHVKVNSTILTNT